MKSLLLIFVSLFAASAQTSIRVNAGGPAYTDKAGSLWTADTAAPHSYTTAAAITGTTDPTLYQSESWNSAALEYKFPVANGVYAVTLKCAEIYFTAAGKRVFDIVINGQTVEPGFDPYAAAGGANTAIDKTYPVTVAGGSIDIRLVSIVENPKISAIDIEPVVSATSVPPPPATTPPSTVTANPDLTALQAQVSALSTAVAAIQTQIASSQSAIAPAPAPASSALPTLSAASPYPDPTATGPEDVLWLKQQVLALIQIVQALQQETGMK